MTLKIEAVNRYVTDGIEKSLIDRIRSLNFENETIEFVINDRPKVTISENQGGEFFLDYYYRSKFLESVGIAIDPSGAVHELVELVNGDRDRITTYHFSFAPMQLSDASIQFVDGRYTIVPINEEQYLDLCETFPDVGNLLKNKGVAEGAILVSKEIARLVPDGQTYNEFFDRLDDIYSGHEVVFGLVNFFWGKFGAQTTTVSCDNFSYASASGAHRLWSVEIGSIDASNHAIADTVLKQLDALLFYRLILRSELSSNHVFQQSIFLRSVLDPFFEQNSSKISEIKNTQSLAKKTEAQARIVFQFLNDNGIANGDLEITEAEFTEFLGVRNRIIHPTPADGIEDLHLLYDKLGGIRKAVYLFVNLCIRNNVRQSFGTFFVESSL